MRTIDLSKYRVIKQPLRVEVVNQLDLSTIEALLTQIRDSTQAIDENTDQVEAKLDQVILEVQTNGTTNNTNLLNVISELQKIDANTDNLETQLASIISNTATNATELTLLAIKAKTDQLTFISNKLRTTGEDGGGSGVGSKRTINTVESSVNGSTVDNVQSMSIYFDGKNGTLDGVTVPDGYIANFAPNGGTDTISSISYTVPTNKGQRVVITYVNN